LLIEAASPCLSLWQATSAALPKLLSSQLVRKI
jgi:hypothetical protein